MSALYVYACDPTRVAPQLVGPVAHFCPTLHRACNSEAVQGRPRTWSAPLILTARWRRAIASRCFLIPERGTNLPGFLILLVVTIIGV